VFPPEMDLALRAAVKAAIAGAGAVPVPVLHFLHRRADGPGGDRLLPARGGDPQPGDELFVDGRGVGTVAGVCQWWTVAAGRRVRWWCSRWGGPQGRTHWGTPVMTMPTCWPTAGVTGRTYGGDAWVNSMGRAPVYPASGGHSPPFRPGECLVPVAAESDRRTGERAGICGHAPARRGRRASYAWGVPRRDQS
jgi:hypothetical protein